ncbi:crustacean hyperglycemic hormones isoform X2 [Apis mellifera]|uniref:Crustacean hyperglycemic hormones isoform X2 n=1 Tax=Apis mellifera TaxID=7460 RepID=A0A7M7H050_APIME|nr:crustacean hyperglycemic hormones isoform X2 [Apis mellifera]|eukprot:XP_006571870.1 crustacean hyperglycemic hormones isoform X2 [Apis mellifera]
MGDNDRHHAMRSCINLTIHYTMHRQQRIRSSLSSSLLSLPLSMSRSSILPASLSPTTSISSVTTSTSTSTLSSPLSSSSIFLPSFATWSTSNLSSYSWNVQQTSYSRLPSLPSELSIMSIPYPRLVSVLAWSVTLLLVSSCIGLTDAGILNGHPLGKRSFIDIQCKGIYDKSIFARLDRICEDCYNLFREPQLHQLCRQDCFGTEYFTSCIQALLLEDEKEKLYEMVEYLGRKK